MIIIVDWDIITYVLPSICIYAVKGSKFSCDTVPSDDIIEIVSSDDGSESSEEEEEGEGLGAGLEEGEEGEASSDMQLSDQEQGQRVQRSNGGQNFAEYSVKIFLPAHANCLEEQVYAHVCVCVSIMCVCLCVHIPWLRDDTCTYAVYTCMACWLVCWLGGWVAGWIMEWAVLG